MVTITPISRGDEDRPYREFFTPEYFTQRLGLPGYWRGGGVRQLGLRNPVESGVLKHLLEGRTPDGTKPLAPDYPQLNREPGWCLDLRVPQSVSVLWALAPEPARRSIETAHLTAAAITLLDLERDLSGFRTGRHLAEEQLPNGVFACFPGRASPDQMPQLSVRPIIPNQGFLPDGTVTNFGSDQLFERRAGLATAYQTLLGGQLQKHIGIFQEWADTDLRLVGVPSELCLKFGYDRNARHELTDAWGRPATALQGKELFEAWRRLGDKYGWGGKQAEALLDHINRRTPWKKLMNKWDDTVQRVRDCSAQVVESVKELVLQPRKPPTHSRPTRSRDKDMGHSH